MYEQVEFLLRTLSPRYDALQRLTHRFAAAFNISASGQIEVVTFKPEILYQIADLNITLNLFIGGDVDDAN